MRLQYDFTSLRQKFRLTLSTWNCVDRMKHYRQLLYIMWIHRASFVVDSIIEQILLLNPTPPFKMPTVIGTFRSNAGDGRSKFAPVGRHAKEGRQGYFVRTWSLPLSYGYGD